MADEDLIVPVAQRQVCELDLNSLKPPLDLRQVFGNPHPVSLEIGIGKGLFLMRSGLAKPQENFLGIEYARKYLNRARERIEKRPIRNVRVVHAEAMSFMQDWLIPDSLKAIHLYFPDPWPKKRHHKRRIFNQVFLEACYRLLVTQGDLLIATDHADYWAWMCDVLAKQTLFVPSDLLPEPPEDTDGLTNYEIKYQREGRPIFRTGYRKP